MRRLAFNAEEVRAALLAHLRAADHPVPADYGDVCITLGAYGAVVEWTEETQINI